MGPALRVVLFADGSGTIGAGHQVRCGALARALVAAGHDALLLARDLPGSPHRRLWQDLAAELTAAKAGVAEALGAALQRHGPDVLVVDHYDVDAALLAEVGVRTRVALIDDVPSERAWPASLVINSAPGVRPSDYAGQAVALGPSHALVRAEFQAVRHRPEPGEAVLVALGSARSFDADDVLRALLERPGLAVEWVGVAPNGLGGLAPSQRSRVRVHEGLSAADLAGLMARCGAGLLSASSVCLEAACVGLPFAAVATAANQGRLAAGLAERGVPVYEAARAPWRAAAASLGALAGARLAVDGHGAARVAARLLETTVKPASATLRPAVWDDAARLLEWANDAGTRQGSFHEQPIAEDEHRRWLEAKLLDPEARLFVVCDGTEPAGSARLDREGSHATVSLAVAPGLRGRGLGGRILDALRDWTRRARFAERLIAFVREDNLTSLRLFERAGYARAGRPVVNGRPAFRLERDLS